MIVGVGDELRAGGGVPQRKELLLQRMAAELAPGRAAVERGPTLQPEQDAHPTGRRLRTDAPAQRVLLLGEADHAAEQLGPAVRLGQAEGDRPTGTAGHLAHPGHLGPRARQILAVALAEAGGALEHAPTVPAQHVGDGVQLVWRGPRARHRTAVGHRVEQRPRRGEAEGPGFHGLVDQLDHRRDVLVRGRRVVHAALAHGVMADRAVPDHAADVRALRETVHGVQVLAVRHPVPRQAVHDGVARDVLDALHELGQVRPVLGSARGERDAAVAHDDAGHAVPAARRADGIPGELGVEVGVDVHEARGDDAPVGVELTMSLGVERRVDGDHAVADHAHICGLGRSPRAVDNRAVPDDEIHVHKPSPCRRAWRIRACLPSRCPVSPPCDGICHRGDTKGARAVSHRTHTVGSPHERLRDGHTQVRGVDPHGPADPQLHVSRASRMPSCSSGWRTSRRPRSARGSTPST